MPIISGGMNCGLKMKLLNFAMWSTVTVTACMIALLRLIRRVAVAAVVMVAVAERMAVCQIVNATVMVSVRIFVYPFPEWIASVLMIVWLRILG